MRCDESWDIPELQYATLNVSGADMMDKCYDMKVNGLFVIKQARNTMIDIHDPRYRV